MLCHVARFSASARALHCGMPRPWPKPAPVISSVRSRRPPSPSVTACAGEGPTNDATRTNASMRMNMATYLSKDACSMPIRSGSARDECDELLDVLGQLLRRLERHAPCGVEELELAARQRIRQPASGLEAHERISSEMEDQRRRRDAPQSRTQVFVECAVEDVDRIAA